MGHKSTSELTLSPSKLRIVDKKQCLERPTTKPKRFKIVILGNSSVGKTALLDRIISGQFNGDYGTTIGGDIYFKTVTLEGDAPRKVNFMFHDTSGNDRYDLLLPVAMANASAVLLVYDVTDRCSFQALDVWLEKYQKQEHPKSQGLLFVVGNKADLNEAKITPHEAQEKARHFGALFHALSAKTGWNVDALVQDLAQNLLEKDRCSVAMNEIPETTPIINQTTNTEVDAMVVKNGGSASPPNAATTMLEDVTQAQLFKFKIAILGERAVGKTSMLTQFLYNSFDPHYQSTIGIDFFSKNIHVDGRTVRLQLWDTAGQERFRSLIPSYIRSSSAAIIVYDVTDRHSFAEVSHWIKEIRCERGDEAFIMLAANKIDLRSSDDNSHNSCDAPLPHAMVTTAEGEAKAAEIGAHFIEISAKTGYNVQQLFQRMAATLPILLTPGGATMARTDSLSNVINLQEVHSTDDIEAAQSKNQSSCYC